MRSHAKDNAIAAPSPPSESPARVRRATHRRSTPADAAPADKPYHHGALPLTLLAAAESVLVRDGVEGLGLRAIAREAGVSHTAPKHHFGDARGLLNHLAAMGLHRMSDAMRAAAQGVAERSARNRAIGRAYVLFAYEQPDLFRLMFASERVDRQAPVLKAAHLAAMRVLAGMQDGSPGDDAAAAPASAAPPRLEGSAALLAVADWAYVHGLALLLIERRLDAVLRTAPEYDTTLDLVEAVLDGIQLRDRAAPRQTDRRDRRT